MNNGDQLEGPPRPHEPPAQVCTASVSLAAMLSAATALAVALVGLAVWQLLL